MFRKWIGRLVPALAPPSSPRAELENLLADSATDRASFDAHEGTLLRNMLGLRDLNASDVMIPRADIVSVGMTESFSDIITQMTAANHSRLPVRRETLDDIAGFIHIKDKTQATVDAVLYMAFFIPSMIFFTIIAAQYWELAYRTGETAFDSPWEPVLWPARLAMPIGGLLLTLQGIPELFRAFHKMGKERERYFVTH